MSMVKTRTLLIAALVAPVVALPLSEAAAAETMSLTDCIATALESNLNIRDGQEAVARARGGILEARSGFLPNLGLNGSYNFLEETQTVSFPDPVTGTMQEFKLDFTRDYSFQLTLNQPVYTGGRLTGSYRIAKASHEIAEADLETRQADVTLQVTEAFYGLLLARASVEVTEQAIETAEEFLRVVKARYDAGEASGFEVLRAEVEVSNLKPALIGARNGVALSELALKTAMGIDPDEDIDFVGSFGEVSFDIERRTAIETALEQRPEIGIVNLRRDIAAESIRLAKAGRLPSLAVSANYDLRSDELSLDTGEMEKTYAGYLVMSFPIFDGLRTKSQISQAYSQLKQAEISKANLEDLVELETRSALLDIESALETLRSQERNVEMAEEGLEIANDRYVQGYATNLEVMDAQLALNRARTNRIHALHDLNLAISRTKKAMGTLVGDFTSGARP
jgi:outer membrane protein TolC